MGIIACSEFQSVGQPASKLDSLIMQYTCSSVICNSNQTNLDSNRTVPVYGTYRFWVLNN